MQLLRPYVPFDVLRNRLAGLLRYRLDQSPFRGSNPKQGTATALAEIFGSVLWCLHTARTHDTVIESVVCAKVRAPFEAVDMRASLTCAPLFLAATRLQGMHGRGARESRRSTRLPDLSVRLLTCLSLAGLRYPRVGFEAGEGCHRRGYCSQGRRVRLAFSDSRSTTC